MPSHTRAIISTSISVCNAHSFADHLSKSQIITDHLSKSHNLKASPFPAILEKGTIIEKWLSRRNVILQLENINKNPKSKRQ
jgi:hypothetical protein